METLLGYGLALLMGGILGLLGGGGSILTVPILVYIFHVPAVLATGYSLVVVGLSSLFGVINYWRQGLVAVKTGVIFALPAMTAVAVARQWVLAAIPPILSIGPIQFSKDQFILVLFGGLVLVIALFMVKAKSGDTPVPGPSPNLFILGINGLLVGFITGLVGAGGGFMIVPALMVLAKLSLRSAIATSLFIIFLKSLVGVLGDLASGLSIDWPFMLKFLFVTYIGVFIGQKLNQYLPVSVLRRFFGYFVFAMGLVILATELI